MALKSVFYRLWIFGCILLVLIGAMLPISQAQAATTDIASYTMQIELDIASKKVHGSARIRYQNPSEDTLREVYLRLYLKAFSSFDTVWMRESQSDSADGTSEMRGFQVSPDELGDIELHSLKLANGNDLLANSRADETLLHVPLPQSLEPGQVLELDVEWTSTLPRVFARTGYGGINNDFFMVGQWYPKMAVYHNGVWDTEPWHAQSEFFHDFGSYDVSITVPQNYVVAGTGVSDQHELVVGDRKTLRFTANNVTDFAFAASPNFVVHRDTVDGIEVVLYLLPEHEAARDEYMNTSLGSLAAFNTWFGKYPHPRLSVVDVPDESGGAGGMEYPTLVTGGTLGLPIDSGAIALVTAHEIAHQWWPMQTATNEGREPWLDEGLTEYSALRYLRDTDFILGASGIGINIETYDRLQASLSIKQPVNLSAWEYDSLNYAGAVYSKTAIGLLMLERTVGSEQFFAAMAEYLQQYRYQHPTAADFRASLQASLGSEIAWVFDEFLGGNGTIDYAVQSIADDGSSAQISRLGEIQAPVEIAVLSQSGTTQTVQWDGKDQQYSIQASAGDPIMSITIDPERKLAGELVIDNNSLSRTIQLADSTSFGSKVLYWVQWLLHTFALFG